MFKRSREGGSVIGVVVEGLVEVVVHSRVTLSTSELISDQIFLEGEPDRHACIFWIKVRVSQGRLNRRNAPLFNDCIPVNLSAKRVILQLLNPKVSPQPLIGVLYHQSLQH